MMNEINSTHDPERRSWVESANVRGTDFPIQNLPLGVFNPNNEGPRCGMAIGAEILDLRVASDAKLLPVGAISDAVRYDNLDDLFSLGQPALSALRKVVVDLLCAKGQWADNTNGLPDGLLRPMANSEMLLPTSVRCFTDFFAGIYHAEKGAEILEWKGGLPKNYHWLPIAYNGRSSSVGVSGGIVRRPNGQRVVTGEVPTLGPSEWLDFEVEMGCYIGSGNNLGESVPIKDAGNQIVGYCLLNDWSARDLQFWEMVPLGVFVSKGFKTSVSPWVITAEALIPFQAPVMDRKPEAPELLPYLFDEQDRKNGSHDIELSAFIQTEKMREKAEMPFQIVKSNAKYLYWTFAQMIAHQSIGGCNLVPGELLGSGTISGPTEESLGSMFELTAAGKNPLKLPNGETRAFLQDGDTVIFQAQCTREGFVSIGFGECSGQIIS